MQVDCTEYKGRATGRISKQLARTSRTARRSVSNVEIYLQSWSEYY